LRKGGIVRLSIGVDISWLEKVVPKAGDGVC
jgi:hypothetical protein